METSEKINNLYEYSMKELLCKSEIQTFQKLISNYGIDESMKLRKKSVRWFYSFYAPSKPYFISIKKREEFSKAAETMLRIYEKLTNAYYCSESLKNILFPTGKVRNHIGINPGYQGKLQTARLDALYNFSNDSLHFLEINTDIPGGMGDNDMLVKMFDSLPSIKFLQSKFEFSRDTLVGLLYNMLIKKYKEYCECFGKIEKENPHLAIVCSRISDIRLEVDFIVALLKKEGFKVSYADPRDFIYDGRSLTLNGEEVDIINRRENIRDIFRTDSIGKPHSNIRNRVMEFSKTACLNNRFLNKYLKRGYFGHTEDLIRAFAENNVCMVNPFFSAISVQKKAFALLSGNNFRSLFDEEELHVINKYVPWTRVIKKSKTFYDKKEMDLIPFIKVNRQKFVLKPNMGFGGKGVIIGCEVSQAEWEKKINLIIRSGLKYIVQEYIDIPTEKFPVYKNKIFKGFSPQFVNLNFWGLDGKFAGALVRASDSKVINVARGARFVPVYYILN
ncbi:MAG TPA: hypothetical protein VMT35_12725 [Ignavibacteriaceae bacterium]|nr:hypothetical protein [Ignavibacteriaceae bacterium]